MSYALTEPREMSKPTAIAVFCGMTLLAGAIIVARRWLQFEHPDVWVEDGVKVIPSYVHYGLFGLFVPARGYLIIPSKVVSYLALMITFKHYAFLSTVLATAVQAACVGAIAVSPTYLRMRWLCALAVVLIPTGTEVFALPLYTFWWTTILGLLALLWTEERQKTRLAFILIAGFSSPLLIALAPLFALRAVVERRTSEIMATCVAGIVSALQVWLILSRPADKNYLMDSVANWKMVIAKYLGTALYGLGIHGAGLFGIALAAFLIAGLFIVPRKDRLPYFLLGAALGVSIISSLVRVSVTAPHPYLAGPRYFFFPLITTLWMLIWIASTNHRIAQAIAGLFLLAYMPSLIHDFDGPLWKPVKPWKEQVAACIKTQGPYRFDIQYGFPPGYTWHLVLNGSDCRDLEDFSAEHRQPKDALGTAPI